MPDHILIIDDDPDLLAALKRDIRAAGYSVATAQDAEAGLVEVQRQRPDLVLCDVMMPGMNGFQATRRLKSQGTSAAIPVVLMSAKTDPADHFWAQEVGAVCLIAKPFETRALIERLAAILREGAPA